MWLLALPPLVPLLLVAQLTGVKVTSTRQRANSRWGLPCVRIALFPVTRAHRPDPEQENSLDVIVSAFFPWRCLQTDATDLDGSMEHDNQYLKYHVAFLSSGFIPSPPPLPQLMVMIRLFSHPHPKPKSVRGQQQETTTTSYGRMQFLDGSTYRRGDTITICRPWHSKRSVKCAHTFSVTAG